MKSFFKGFFITLLIVGLLFLGGFFFLQQKEGNEAKEWFTQFNEGADKYQILLIGIDALNGKSADNTRSDVMMILDVDNVKKSIRLVSVPRDTRTKIEGHRGHTKINHAYAYGGSELSLKTVNETLGLNIPYYMVIDYGLVKEMVDIIGGVEVEVPMDMDYEDPSSDPPLSIHLKQGRQVLDGDQALQFLRFRKGYKNADLDRVKAQQSFMNALMDRLKSKKTILHGPQLLVSYMDHSQSNMPLPKVSRLGLNIMNIGKENLTTFTLPGQPDTIDEISYYVIDEEQTNRFLLDLGIKK